MNKWMNEWLIGCLHEAERTLKLAFVVLYNVWEMALNFEQNFWLQLLFTGWYLTGVPDTATFTDPLCFPISVLIIPDSPS
jgi:hypothetical protein